MQQAQNRDPDAHDMYIYNGTWPVYIKLCTEMTRSLDVDFYGYAMLELVDELLQEAHAFLSQKECIKAWALLDAACHFNEMIGPEWTRKLTITQALLPVC